MTLALPQEEFRRVVRATPLVALDLLLEDAAGRFLLGLRTNAPARGWWFVPGGRVHKREALREALARVLQGETGLALAEVGDVALHGLYDHVYPDNAFGDPSFDTHYVVAACRMKVLTGRSPSLDRQHRATRFVAVPDLLADPRVHRFVKYYFDGAPPNRFL